MDGDAEAEWIKVPEGSSQIDDAACMLPVIVSDNLAVGPSGLVAGVFDVEPLAADDREVERAFVSIKVGRSARNAR